MERLTDKETYCSFTDCDYKDKCRIKTSCYEKRLYDKLKEYEVLEEQGLLRKLPYNLETCDVVYYVDKEDHEIYRLNADEITISKMMISRKMVYEVDSYEFFYEDFGRIVFTTKKEAEKALAEMWVE